MRTRYLLFCLSLLLPATLLAKPKKLVFIAGNPSHGAGSHEHRAGSMLLADALNTHYGDKIDASVTWYGWPKDESVLDGADGIVIFCTGGGRHLAIAQLDKIDKLAKKGVGIGCIHYGVEVPPGDPGDAFLRWIGGHFSINFSVNPHWTPEFKEFPKHPAANGIKPFSINDEWYFHMRFQKDMVGVTPILSAPAPAETMKRGDGPHSGNKYVRASVAAGEKQPVVWAYQRPNDGGRGFGFTGAHKHANWKDDNFRKTGLNVCAWIVGLDIPADGVPSATPTDEQIAANQDHTDKKKKPAPPKKKVDKGSALAKDALFASKVITEATPGLSVDIDVDLKGAKELYLVVTDGGDSYAADWVDWVAPRFVGAKGEKKLTDLKWKGAQAQWGKVSINKNAGGGAMRVAGKPVEGIGTHALSVIAYDVPAGYTRFKATGGIDNGGSDQGGNSSVQFFVFSKNPNVAKLTPKRAPAAPAGAKTPAVALESLDVAEGLVASTFASEPMMLSPSSIDIDHRGRVWVCEVTNYRRHKNHREEGDRILILEDTNGDSVADSAKVFHQGRDVDSAHGVTVLGDKIIVAVGDKILIFTDANGDDKPDGPAVPLFTGISGTQHDHGIHAVHFGPDGRLYFNFGNAGRQIKDAAGKPIIDMAGNEVNNKRKPYQEGMVFRCEMDGSKFETLGWNFRNNWEACVDSFGSVWQSDNDDDGNRGVRINYVMEYGNYGYKDEFTGKGWRDKRSNMPKLPELHWYQNSPGVIPNVVNTGAGSPTGIIVYEGELLPAIFHNQVIHCDAGPNTCRAYPVKSSGAGYTGEMVDVLKGTRDRWYRPSDVCVAPDGSLLIADWYDPGVGGHNMRDLDNGRIYRVAPAGHKYAAAKPDFSSADGAAAALKSPNMATRYLAWTALNKMGTSAKSAVAKLAQDTNARYRARGLWLLATIDLQAAINQAAADADENVRGMAIRIARRHQTNVIATVAKSARDASPVVRRECAIALRHSKSDQAPGLWAQLASVHMAGDRWYLEALGIAADKNEDAFFAAWQAKVGKGWNSPAGRDIVWRSRAKAAPALLAKIVLDPATKSETHPHYMRAFDFHKGPEKDAALQEILLAQ